MSDLPSRGSSYPTRCAQTISDDRPSCLDRLQEAERERDEALAELAVTEDAYVELRDWLLRTVGTASTVLQAKKCVERLVTEEVARAR